MRISIRMAVVLVFVFATALTAILAIGLQYYFGHALAKDAASRLYANAATSAANQLIHVGVQTTNIVDLLVEYPFFVDQPLTDAQRRLFVTAMQQNPLFYGIYLGCGDGSFYELINLQVGDSKARQSLKADSQDRWVIVVVEGEGVSRVRQFKYMDENFKLRATRSEATNFDVTTRPWYISALNSDKAQTTDIYKFSQRQVSGLTVSKRVQGTTTVVGIDMTLSGISNYLNEQVSKSEAVSYVYKADGRIVATSLQSHLYVSGQSNVLENETTDLEAVPSKALTEFANDKSKQGRMVEIDYKGTPHFVYVTPLAVQAENPSYFGILVPTVAVMGTFMDKVSLSIAITAAFLLFLSPLSWFFATPIVRPIKQLAHENDKIRLQSHHQVTRINTRVMEVDQLSESMVGMVTAIQTHELQQQKLMDAFIQLIAQAIDDKSAYTGGHCARVPELAFMLVEQASNSDAPAFKDFRFETDDQWREYRIAAWLHDCGKIITPEHIVDKGSKLEAIYNRIHEVRMRFEVLWRDADISYWKQLQQYPEKKVALIAELKKQQQQLLDEFSFIAQCNVGGEYLDEEKQARLLALAQKTWLRHFDNRLGLSPVEALHIQTSVNKLPVIEKLLDDKPEHIIKRTRTTDYAPELGINMDVPEYLYNLGEIYNLCVSRGTLTKEDRFKINEHMISTIKMLEGLPFPQELKNVPRYASTHHETMNGLGYPRRLSGDELSIPERILAVADIFEALTAADRPYKKAKPVSEALDILHKMVLDQHIDRDCFELFVRSKVYAQYADKYLSPEQKDAVDESKYVA